MSNNVDNEWFKKEWFWVKYGPVMFDTQTMSKTESEIDGVLNLTSIKKDEKLLDVCCGFGRHSLELAKWGIDVTGIDITEAYLEKGRQNQLKDKIENCQFINQDIRTYDKQNYYDGAVCLWNSFGYWVDEDDDIKAVKNIYNSLKKGGFFLLDTPGKEVLAAGFEENGWYEKGDLKILVEYSVELNWTVMKNRWLLYDKDNNGFTEFEFSHSIYSALEQCKLLAECGFEKIEVYGSFDGSPYDNHSEQLITIGWK